MAIVYHPSPLPPLPLPLPSFSLSPPSPSPSPSLSPPSPSLPLPLPLPSPSPLPTQPTIFHYLPLSSWLVCRQLRCYRNCYWISAWVKSALQVFSRWPFGLNSTHSSCLSWLPTWSLIVVHKLPPWVASHQHLAYSPLVLCQPRTCLRARNGLVNEVKFLGLIPPKWWKTNEISSYYIALPLQIYSSPFQYPYFFWAGFRKTLQGYTVAKAPASPKNLTWFTRPLISNPLLPLLPLKSFTLGGGKGRDIETTYDMLENPELLDVLPSLRLSLQYLLRKYLLGGFHRCSCSHLERENCYKFLLKYFREQLKICEINEIKDLWKFSTKGIWYAIFVPVSALAQATPTCYCCTKRCFNTASCSQYRTCDGTASNWVPRIFFVSYCDESTVEWRIESTPYSKIPCSV